VPINPLLKAEQVAYILRDCNVRVLVTTRDRADLLANRSWPNCPDLHSFGAGRWLESAETAVAPSHPAIFKPLAGPILLAAESARSASGSGRSTPTWPPFCTPRAAPANPRAWCLSHRNMLTGAYSVAEYLGNRADDRILAVLPFSFRLRPQPD
jgi:acyl-CoA synthetase (AMP-forming)/AMP-acid ligase II